MKPIPYPYSTGHCFFGRDRNSIDLKLTFQETETEPAELVLHWNASPMLTGLGRILHGGIQSGLSMRL